MEKKIGRPKNPDGNINDIRNRSEKKKLNRDWYYERGYLINKIKYLIIKYNVDVVECGLALDYATKPKPDLETMIIDLSRWIVTNRDTALLPSAPQPRRRI